MSDGVAEKSKELVPLSQRMALALPEASALSGLKVCALRAAIWAGDLAFIRSGNSSANARNLHPGARMA